MPPLTAMKGEAQNLFPNTTLKMRHNKLNGSPRNGVKGSMNGVGYTTTNNNKNKMGNRMGGLLANASFMSWRPRDLSAVLKYHPIPCVFAASLLFFMFVEYTLRMIPPSSPPFDLGFVITTPLHRLLASRPALNTLLAGLNTVFVGMQTTYIVWTWVVEGRPRATISALFMFTCRGILGYTTQLPVPQGFLGSGADFPVGNVSFFLFYSGHVAASVIASLDMKRMQRWELAGTFDTLNILQFVRLLSTRGHYTIDLVVGVGAGILFDYLAGEYVKSKKKAEAKSTTSPTGNGNGNGNCSL
ncbi:phosphatidylcholine:diacylglycerol cholinephosphotransferase 1-like [Cornus florida]|uniref:phosphatidylcholine:diacylglycerol cholinephosphotransferase 1-like n=1 Tax=Cornus florida TaxID=4283 RepID=UPI0028975D5B|nr:phosphatidylcholine:diacylglycerol cholinephosphotransferase 1-like [Cornus florida]